MTLSTPTTQTARGANSHSVVKFMATALQRRGRTMTEIAEELDCRRETIVQMLYVEVVRDVV